MFVFLSLGYLTQDSLFFSKSIHWSANFKTAVKFCEAPIKLHLRKLCVEIIFSTQQDFELWSLAVIYHSMYWFSFIDYFPPS